MTKMDDLNAAEKSLLEKLESVRANKKKEENAAKYLTDWDDAFKEDEWRTNGMPVVVEEIKEGEVYVYSPEYVGVYVEFCRTIPSRKYGGEGINRFHINDWENALVGLLKLEEAKMIQLQYRDGVKEEIVKYQTLPRMRVELDEDKGRVVLTVLKGEYHLARQIVGVRKQKEAVWWILKGELPNVFDKLEHEDNIEWSDEARAELSVEFDKRTLLDKIALAEDYPSDLKFTEDDFELRPFQRKGIAWLGATNYRALLSDQMGLGKTVQAIACWMELRKTIPDARALVVCPANLKANWVHEIRRFTGEEPFVLSGMSPDVKIHGQRLVVDRPDAWVIINYDILGSMVQRSDDKDMGDGRVMRTNIEDIYLWAQMLNMSRFELVIGDEIHYAKNLDAKRTKAFRKLEADRIIGLTGTPVLNRPGELWPFLNMIAPDKFPSYEGFIYQYTWNNKEARNVDELRTVLKTLMLRRTKKEVMADLPPINRIYHFHELTEEARQRYELALAGIYQILAEWNPEQAGEQTKITSILAQITRLKQIASLDKVNAVADEAIEISDSDENGGKVLIFTQFVPVMHEIAKRLGHEALVYCGDMSFERRTQAIEKFKSDPSLKFFVGTIQTMGTGLNLEMANNVMFVDYMWTPAVHMQAEERAYGRLSDPHPINSYYITADDTIENYIQQVIARKLKVIEQVVEGLDTERQSSIANEILFKIKQDMWKARKDRKKK